MRLESKVCADHTLPYTTLTTVSMSLKLLGSHGRILHKENSF